jgi:hypothetical protein
LVILNLPELGLNLAHNLQYSKILLCI